MKRRRLLQLGCAHCVAFATAGAAAQEPWTRPARFARPETATDEGGLWALMDREETRLRRGGAGIVVAPGPVRSPRHRHR